MTTEQDTVMTVAGLMALAARTAPKARGIDTLEIRVLAGKDLRELAARLEQLGHERHTGFFLRDAGNLAASDACVLIGSRGGSAAGVNCGGCGSATCAEMEEERKKERPATPFEGPNCVLRMADLGIALGSAVRTAQFHNADNRVMYSAGVAARDLGLLPRECTVAYAIPLSATGKNIFFDRPSLP